jgi:hypothetical protein
MYHSLGLQVQSLQKTSHESYKTGNVTVDMENLMLPHKRFKDSGSYSLSTTPKTHLTISSAYASGVTTHEMRSGAKAITRSGTCFYTTTETNEQQAHRFPLLHYFGISSRKYTYIHKKRMHRSQPPIRARRRRFQPLDCYQAATMQVSALSLVFSPPSAGT